LKKLHHPNIIELLDHYSTKAFDYIFLEYCEGDLLNVLLDVGYFTEDEARPIIK